MYISLRIRKRVMLCVIAILSMLAAVAVMPTFAKEEKTDEAPYGALWCDRRTGGNHRWHYTAGKRLLRRHGRERYFSVVMLSSLIKWFFGKYTAW